VRVTAVGVSPSPDTAGYARLEARVAYDDPAVPGESYWIEVPDAYADSLSPNGNPWLACVMPLAMQRGEPLHVDAPVDAALLDGMSDVARLWTAWFPPMRPVPITVASVVGPPRAHEPTGRFGAFFSGGVDSFFTLLRREGERARNPYGVIDDLMIVHGFDVPLTDGAAFGRLRASLERVADEMGKTLIAIRTNVRLTKFRDLEWARLGHGPALAAVALALEPRFRAVALASAREYPYSSAGWGSHPVSDPLFSTQRCRLVHDGGTYNRVDKVCAIAESDLAMRHLHVCWRSLSDVNCGACEKCYRTLTTLEIVGALERCTTFPTRTLDLDRVARMYCYNWVTKGFNRSNRALAVGRGRPDIVAALDASYRLTKRRDVFLTAARTVEKIPVVWRLATPLRRAAMRGIIH
jgi:hypothetical protein